MLRSSLYVVGALMLGSTAVAQQQDASARLRTVPNQPIPITYDMRTKTLSADNGAGAFFGPDVLYVQTCPSGFFIGLSAGDQLTDSGQIPAPNDGILAAAGGGGCAVTYTVNGFEVAYCSNQASIDLAVSFHSLYDPCTDINGATPGVGFLITGLPGSNTGGAICYALTIDLMGTSFEFTLAGSGDGTWNSDDSLDSFGYTYEFTNLTGTGVGAIIAGDPVFLGQGCDFAVGTVFQVQDPTGTSPDGTGYFSTDAFGLMQGGVFAGCFFFGGWPSNIWSSFHLRLHSEDAGCASGPGTAVCPGDGSYPSTSGSICPCGNISAMGSGEGCINSSTTSGGTLLGSGTASIGADDLQLDATHPAGNGGLLLLNTSIFATGAAVFDGLACVGGGPRALPGADNGVGDDQVAGDGVRNLGPALMSQVNAVFPGFFVSASTYWAQYWYRDVLCGPPPAPCNTVCTNPPPAAANFTAAYTWTTTP